MLVHTYYMIDLNTGHEKCGKLELSFGVAAVSLSGRSASLKKVTSASPRETSAACGRACARSAWGGWGWWRRGKGVGGLPEIPSQSASCEAKEYVHFTSLHAASQRCEKRG